MAITNLVVFALGVGGNTVKGNLRMRRGRPSFGGWSTLPFFLYHCAVCAASHQELFTCLWAPLSAVRGKNERQRKTGRREREVETETFRKEIHFVLSSTSPPSFSQAFLKRWKLSSSPRHYFSSGDILCSISPFSLHFFFPSLSLALYPLPITFSYLTFPFLSFSLSSLSLSFCLSQSRCFLPLFSAGFMWQLNHNKVPGYCCVSG